MNNIEEIYLENAIKVLKNKCCGVTDGPDYIPCPNCAANITGMCEAQCGDGYLPILPQFSGNAIPFFEKYVREHSPKPALDFPRKRIKRFHSNRNGVMWKDGEIINK